MKFNIYNNQLIAAIILLLFMSVCSIPCLASDDKALDEIEHVSDNESAVEHETHDTHAVTSDEKHGGGHDDHGTKSGKGHSSLGKSLPIWSAIPFVGILLSIALLPLFAPRFWHHHFPKISAFWAVLFAVPFLIAYKSGGLYEIMHIYIADYIPFIILLWGLYAASGGILLRGTLIGTPVVNLVLLLIGTILASWIGTTGASMILIRPVLKANKSRSNKMHVVIFFIFLVSNIGGSLTPLGDPPLFLGFLHGVPFFWTLNLLPHMGLAAGWLLLLFFLMDSFLFRKDKDKFKELANMDREPLKLEGLHNLIFFAGIMGAVLFSGMVQLKVFNVMGVHLPLQNIIRDLFIVLMVYLSVKTTKTKIRKDNSFTWFPIKEVAYLFAGIFMTIIPALAMLRAGTEGGLGFIVDFVKEPIHYFWITGALSSFLDNAPTYLTFYNLAQGRIGIDDFMVNQILTESVQHPMSNTFIQYLKAISAGAVFFGAMTYIGNAPNFMVRSIAEESGLKMPSFFGYMLWSIAILVPLFIVVTWVFI
ncbi:MAG: sodium:proton antiporter [Candidatus Electryonea clarkiae]|nr:sodium:proton antiporter [Candidatus Electryonea clarkiae]MDP8287771.1 sodium:proton antiporter [Candidatus Electryonea clarkiae]